MEPSMSRISLAQARAAKSAVQKRVKRLRTVTGVGITRIDGEYAVKLNVSEPIDPGIDIPGDVDGVRIHIEVTGAIKPR